jgi:arylsulfatase A-like enzyme
MKNSIPKRMKKFLLFLFLVIPLCISCSDEEQKPNVLFIAVDDMADWVAYLDGHPNAITPNLDKLASQGIYFTNAHCASPICGPSRASILTGLRPETSGCYTNLGTYVDYVPDAVSLPRYFLDHNYHVMGAGKINHALGMVVPENWHEYGPDCGIVGSPFTNEELLTEGMDPTRVIARLNCTLPMNGGLSLIDRPEMKWNSFDWGPLDVDDNEMPDGEIAQWAVNQLERDHDSAFFLAVGFYKPHQPFFVPRKYFDLYDPHEIQLPLTKDGDLDDIPQPGIDFAHAAWSAGTHATVVKHDQWRAGVRAYLATITFADAQVGRVLEALEKSSHADNTWIVLWSDHGWSLGQKEHWGKHEPWQASLKVPLIIVPPKSQRPGGFEQGVACNAPVSLLDLYPTLLEACGLPQKTGLDGESLLPLLEDPETSWNEAVVSSVGRGSHSVFTRKWRYIHYFDGSEELYDLEEDPEEWTNLAADPGYTSVKNDLSVNIPVDKTISQFVRWGKWKAIVRSNGNIELYNIHETFGISEHNEVAGEHPEIVASIRTYLADNDTKHRHVLIPD